MNSTIAILIGTQLLFTIGDLLARQNIHKHGFTASTLLSGWFVVYVVFRVIATVGQLYVLSRVDLGKTMALFGATSIVLANVLGFLILKEVLSPMVYGGVVLAIVAFLLLALR